MTKGEVILYTTEDGQSKISLKNINNTVWITQLQLAELFDTTKQNISLHLKNIFEDGELFETSVVKEYLTTASDGKQYLTTHYNLDMILAVGYRVRSSRGVQFRKWANTVLKEYLVKGFAMDDEKLKGVDNWDYFDEWLERIREIRASEKRFYQKIKDIYATAIDYDKAAPQAREFFAKTQNKMLWAITGNTAPELKVNRSDASKHNMGLTSFKGVKVRKLDIATAKNYLTSPEIEELNRVVTMYLDYAEDQAKRRQGVTMSQWEEKLNKFLEFNDREVLTHAGKITAKKAQQIVELKYEEFDEKRQQQELEYSVEELVTLGKSLEGNNNDKA